MAPVGEKKENKAKKEGKWGKKKQIYVHPLLI